MQNLAAISKAFGFAAGFNLQCWGFLQDLPQLKTIYQDKWESFIANAGVLQFLTPADMTTAEYLQKRGGMKTSMRQTRSMSHSQGGLHGGASETEERLPLLPIEEMMSLPNDEQIVFFAGTHSPAKVGRLPYLIIPRLQGLYDPDPFHS